MHLQTNKIINDGSQLVNSQVHYDALVLDARFRQSLVTVRSLGSRGLRVAALDTSNWAPAFSSRWCQQKFISLADEDTEGYLIYLEQVLNDTGAQVLLTSSDATIALIREHRERLEQRVCIALARESALGIAVNKEQTLAIAGRLGLGIPRGVPVTTVNEVKAALHEIELPAVVKPVESWVRGKQLGARFVPVLVTTPEEARRAVEELTALGGTTLFQQFLTGRREAISFFYAKGLMYARFAQWARRMDPPLGGTSVLRQSIAIPTDTGTQAERLVREIELEGYSEIEFRRDEAGKPYLMEINPRLSASVELAVRAGVDFPYLLYQWAHGMRIDMVDGYRVGGWMRYLMGDFTTTIASILQSGRPGISPPAKALLDFGVSFFTPMRYDYLDWRDPLPIWTATVGSFRHLSQQGASKVKFPIQHDKTRIGR